MTLDVRELDADDEVVLRRWWEIEHATALERPLDLSVPWEAARVAVPQRSPDRELRLLGAHDGARMVGAGRIDLPLTGNSHLAFGGLWVDPPERRRGVGTALLEHTEALVRVAGRSTLLLDVHAPMDGVSPGRTMLERHGYELAETELAKVADLRATEPLWPALEAHAAERMGDYRTVWFLDRVPDEHVGDVCTMFARFLSEIPLGTADIRPEPWDEARLRAMEDRMARSGNRYLMVAACAPSGQLVGHSDALVRTLAPRLAEIRTTLVMREHRGHRLGLAMKVALHRRVRELFPQTELIGTGNADVNEWMNAVNDQLGYRAVDQMFGMQKVL